MSGKYIVSIDQSTQGTKALLFDENGNLIARADRAHRQIVSENGWVSHDLEEIYRNTVAVFRDLLESSGIEKWQVVALGISNQRETTAMWERATGKPLAHAVVWQCGRAEGIAKEIEAKGYGELVREKTGIPLSGYFPACKMAWLLRNTPGALEHADCISVCPQDDTVQGGAEAQDMTNDASVRKLAEQSAITSQPDVKQRNTNVQKSSETGIICQPVCMQNGNASTPEIETSSGICLGTIDSWLVFRLTGGKTFATDYSNASRTQLFNIRTLEWDDELCRIFGIPKSALPEVRDSDSCFGYTDMAGYLDKPIPIMGVLGDSHGALFGQGCIHSGMIKATYGTGSSLMMNIGDAPVKSTHGMVTSIAWGMGGKVTYCLEGNLNYTGAVITWLKDDLHMIESASETQGLAEQANPEDQTYLIPAFSGLGAPYWDADARAAFIGMTRTTGRKEIVKAALESIAYQITDLIRAMEMDIGGEIAEIRVDGGPSRNRYLMQFQSDISGRNVCVPQMEELSGIGAAYAAGISAGLFDQNRLFALAKYEKYEPGMDEELRDRKYHGWKAAVDRVLTN